MLLTEWNTADALRVREEEGVLRGIQQGMQQGMQQATQQIFALLEKGVSLEEAKRQLSREYA